jgi:hypothetical protein
MQLLCDVCLRAPCDEKAVMNFLTFSRRLGKGKIAAALKRALEQDGHEVYEL